MAYEDPPLTPPKGRGISLPLPLGRGRGWGSVSDINQESALGASKAITVTIIQ